MRNIADFLQAEAGATAVEYALIASIITIGLLTIWSGIATELSAELSEVSSSLK